MCEFTILLPCLNESETIGICIQKAKKFLSDAEIEGEILVADNGSTDKSVEIAKVEGARIVSVEKKGYGNALIAGINSANGKYIIMGDADDSYNFLKLHSFVQKLRDGYDLVMGNRFKGGIEEGAMPFLHRYLGNPVLSFLGRIFFKSPIKDFHCGLRGFNRDQIKKLELVTPGMEFASEMIVKATILGYKITEVPIILHKDGRTKPPHLKTWKDGWRHLIFLLMYCPRWLFFFPAILLLLFSAISFLILITDPLHIHKIGFDIHTLTITGSMIILSYQLLLFAIFIRIFSMNQGLYPAKKKHMYFFKIFTLERGIFAGIIMTLSGFIIFFILFLKWKNMGYGPIIDISHTFRLLIPAITLISIGIQTIFASFFLRILGIKQKVLFK